MEKSATASFRVTNCVRLFWTDAVLIAPNCTRVKKAGLRLGNTPLNRRPYARRLNPTAGEITAAVSSRQNGGNPSDFSSTRFAIRNSGSPRKLPPMPLAI